MGFLLSLQTLETDDQDRPDVAPVSTYSLTLCVSSVSRSRAAGDGVARDHAPDSSRARAGRPAGPDRG